MKVMRFTVLVFLKLIDLGTDVSAKDNRVRTPLALIARGADIFSKNSFGRTFAHVSPDILPRAYERLHVSTVRSYLEHQ
jgi:hypothetical protein